MPARHSLIVGSMIILMILGAADSASAYYSPRQGRWLSRDPIGEKGTVLTSREVGQRAQDGRSEGHVSSQEPERAGEPLYLFVENSPVCFADYIGLACMIPLVEEYEHNFGTHHKGILLQGSDWDYGPGGPWYYSFGVSPWNGNPMPTPANTRYIRQLRNDVFAWFRKLEDGQAKGKKCSCATCADIYSCIKYRSVDWNGTWYDLLTNNCWDFVADVKDKCCLKRL